MGGGGGGRGCPQSQSVEYSPIKSLNFTIYCIPIQMKTQSSQFGYKLSCQLIAYIWMKFKIQIISLLFPYFLMVYKY